MAYANEREVFGRAIGQNQSIQHPIAKAYASIEAAKLMVYHAAALYDAGQPCGAEANMAKMLAADASWEAANVAFQTHGGYVFFLFLRFFLGGVWLYRALRGCSYGSRGFLEDR